MSRPGWNDRDCGGYLGKTPELRFTQSGTAVTNINMACPIYYNKEEKTEWVNAALFGKTAEFCCKYAEKGDMVRVTGMQVTKKYRAKDGTEKEAIEIQGQTFQLIKKVGEKKAVEEAPPPDDDVPF